MCQYWDKSIVNWIESRLSFAQSKQVSEHEEQRLH